MTNNGLGTVHESDSAQRRVRPLVLELRGRQAAGLARSRVWNRPTANSEVRFAVDGLVACSFRWGEAHHIGTPAFWVDQAARGYGDWNHKLGTSLVEETIACLLGGHGVRSGVALAAFRHLRSRGLIAVGLVPDASAIEAALAEPIPTSDPGRVVRYRFPRQRSGRVRDALLQLGSEQAPSQPELLRGWLMGIPGIGPKTASWIVRNTTGSESVAVIDVHIQRAGLAARVFSPRWVLPRDYLLFEAAFLAYAVLGKISPRTLDACIWHVLQALGPAGHSLLPSGTGLQHVPDSDRRKKGASPLTAVSTCVYSDPSPEGRE